MHVVLKYLLIAHNYVNFTTFLPLTHRVEDLPGVSRKLGKKAYLAMGTREQSQENHVELGKKKGGGWIQLGCQHITNF
jgi:hypothetical protein